MITGYKSKDNLQARRYAVHSLVVLFIVKFFHLCALQTKSSVKVFKVQLGSFNDNENVTKGKSEQCKGSARALSVLGHFPPSALFLQMRSTMFSCFFLSLFFLVHFRLEQQQ